MIQHNIGKQAKCPTISDPNGQNSLNEDFCYDRVDCTYRLTSNTTVTDSL